MTDERLVMAWQHYCVREYALAEKTCREILRENLEDFGSWRLLGEICLVQGKFEHAIDAYRQAECRSRLSAEDLNNLGVALLAREQPAHAEQAHRQSLEICPENSRCWCNLGVALSKQGKFEEAAVSLRRALEMNLDELRAYHELAFALIAQGKAGELVACLTGLLPGTANHAEAYYALGLGRAALFEWEEAVRSYRAALALRPEFAEAFCDLGCALIELGRFDEGITSLRRAIELQPSQAVFWKNLGSGLTRQGKSEEALGYYEHALKLNPNYPQCQHDVAATLIRLGDYRRGWEELERRPETNQIVRQLGRPLWDGSPLEGRTVLMVAEQGLGDTLQLVRYAPLVKKRCGTVMLACQRALLPLLESCPGIDRLVPQDGIPRDYDVIVPLMSLPRVFATTLETVPAPIPYLHARPDLVERWRKELRPLGAVPGGSFLARQSEIRSRSASLVPVDASRAAGTGERRHAHQPANGSGKRADS